MTKGLIKWIRKSTGTLFFIGYVPIMPGTVGSAITVAMLWYFSGLYPGFFHSSNTAVLWFSSLVFIAICIYLTNDAVNNFGSDDPKQIILDECAGQLITFFLIPLSWRVLLLGFFLFRFFDIVKPFPVFKFEDLDDGLGITMDDIAAGIMANLSLFIILWLYHGIKAYL